MRILLLLSLLLAAAPPRAEEIVAPPMGDERISAEERQVLDAQSKALHEKANAMRAAAEDAFTTENNACWQKFLVSSCQKDAKKVKTARLMEANAVEKEAREIDRKLRRANFAEHQAQKAEDVPKRAADAAEQAEKNRQQREEAMTRVEKKRQEAEARGK